MSLDMRMTRLLRATPAEVFDAYTDAEQQKIWFSITFEEKDGGSLMTVVQSGFPVAEVRGFFAAEVWAGALDRIEAYLSRTDSADV